MAYWGRYNSLNLDDVFKPIYGTINFAYHENIKRVIFNPPATIIFWTDGKKTVVKASENDEFDPEKGIAMAIAKRYFGNKGNYYNHIKKWLLKEGDK